MSLAFHLPAEFGQSCHLRLRVLLCPHLCCSTASLRCVQHGHFERNPMQVQGHSWSLPWTQHDAKSKWGRLKSAGCTERWRAALSEARPNSSLSVYIKWPRVLRNSDSPVILDSITSKRSWQKQCWALILAVAGVYWSDCISHPSQKHWNIRAIIWILTLIC